jgi:Ca-activated chloride channel family protein
MNRRRVLLSTLFLIPIVLMTAFPVSADGIIIPEPPICDPAPCPRPIPIAQLAIEYHHVRVTIEDQIATTHVDQVFRNDNDWQIEGTYMFPIPVGATISEFVLWIDGEPVEGKVLTREEARQTYEQIVRTMRDPALLEYMDRGAVQASIFPIPPGGRRRIELEYTEVLTAESGLINYRYPLNTEKFSTQPLEEVSISVSAESSVPIRAVYSPSHDVSIDRDGDFDFLVGYEAYDVKPDKDFDLYFSVAEENFGLNLISYRDDLSDEDGFFLLLAAPSVEVDPRASISKDVILVLDRSGSMEGEKFAQAQEALQFILDHLNPEDRFNIIVFSTGTISYASSLRPASEADDARRWVDSLSARGSTDINLALLEAVSMAGKERPAMVIFLTDGVPTEGETDTDRIVRNIQNASPENVRLFAFGVGYDVDTFLLDTLAQSNHGATTYVTPDQAIDETVSSFYAKVNDPVLTDLAIDFGDVVVYDVYPEPLPDLFAGSQLVIVGRYKGSGFETVKLSGEVNGELQIFSYPEQRFRRNGGPEFLPRLWATRKVGDLLNQVRLEGPEEEIVDQIVKLSIRYGIITPYTSFLVTEPEAFGEEAQNSIADDAFEGIMSAPTQVSGMGAVERAAEESKILGADIPAELPQSSVDMVRLAGPHTFKFVDGIWIDTRFDPDRMELMRIPFLSEEYFQLADSNQDIAAALALGERVIVITGEYAYQIVGSDEEGGEVVLPEVVPENLPPVDQGDNSEVQSPPSDDGFNFGCPGLALALGMVGVPILRRKKS